eukprot:CAMPEP_0198217316 /NCGR_PEP_ID=MMETSP1445-20131203/62877_1 /TAXON_ID=36898 /ORGANISM="Pyramimonas sp., Strain CCMP2087" /LENGTH=420 /DNA_ID=CAMNT_0043893951 /DNA_START=162 /DNA_END=1421 /DNA_ORIENTATION=+
MEKTPSAVAYEVFPDDPRPEVFAVASVERASMDAETRPNMTPKRRHGVSEARGDMPGFRSWRKLEHPEDEDTVTMPTRFGKTLFPRGPCNMHEICGDKHVSCWSEPAAHTFQVRGRTYLEDNKKAKVPSEGAAFSLYRTDIAPGSVRSATQDIEGLRLLVKSKPESFFFIWHWKAGFQNKGLSAVHTFERQLRPGEDPVFDRTFRQFLRADRSGRNNMVKMIPRILKGNKVLTSAIDVLGGTRPVIIGKKLATTYYETKNSIEVIVDINSSFIATKVQDLVFGGAQGMVIDLAFLIEGKEAAHLPERVLGSCRLTYVDVNLVVHADERCPDATSEIRLADEQMANAVAEVLKNRDPTNSFTFFAPPELSRLDKLVAQNVGRSGQDYLKGRVEEMKRSENVRMFMLMLSVFFSGWMFGYAW